MTMFKRNYLILIPLFLLFVAPGICAYLFYLNPHWLGTATTNKGRLLNPPVVLNALGKKDKPKWRLILWSPHACEERCLQQMDKLARIRLALGRRLYEVEQFVVLNGNQALTNDFSTLMKEQDIHLMRLPQNNVKEVLTGKEEFFIANPDGFLILAYKTDVNPADIYHDLKHLLNTSEKKSG